MNKVVRERFRGLERALKLQAKEYERRLEDLNHEATRIITAQERSISAEKFEGHVNQMNQRFSNMEKDMKAVNDYVKIAEGRTAWTAKYLPWGLTTILAIISMILAYYQLK